MKKNVLLISLMLMLSLGLQAQSDRAFKPVTLKIDGKETELYSASYALIIGVWNYTNGWPALPGVKEDVTAVKKALEEQGFQCTVIENPADKTTLDKAFSDFITKHGQVIENRLLFYFAGHGHTLKNSYGGELGYIVPAGAPDPDKDYASFKNIAMTMKQIEIYAQEIQSSHAMFLFDACFSGSLFDITRAKPASITYYTSKPVRQFITSGSADETVPDKSIFRQQFVSALTTNLADYNDDGYLTGTELGFFLQDKVINYSNNTQHPQYGKIRNPNLDKGDFVFVLSGISPPITTPAEKPIEVKEDIEVYYGSIELKTEISGRLYIDGNFVKDIGTVNSGTSKVITLSNIAVGTHTIEIKGNENWKQEITVYKNQKTQLTAKSTKIVKEYTETFGIKMILVEGGTYIMGSSQNVKLNSYYIGKFEITQGQWYAVMGKNPSKFSGCDSCPVENVSWLDVEDYLSKLNELTGKNYRLPTEAEWEYAALGGNKSKGFQYSGSNNIDEVAWYGENGTGNVSAVGQKKANELGLFDMSGSVFEWCSDWYGDYISGNVEDPKGPENGTSRVCRGGAWDSPIIYCQTTTRRGASPKTRDGDLGFRLAVEP